MEVEVVRSPRRRKTVEARQLNGGVLRVSIPAAMSKAEEERWVALMIERMRPRTADRIDLVERAAMLARRYQLRRPRNIRWVSNQVGRWGSCTPADSTIRISERLADEPAWVLDYVIVHELAHLSRDRHDPTFWALVNRYPKAERARGFLIARGLEPE
jgi:predicted metal-dependent hydrolase